MAKVTSGSFNTSAYSNRYLTFSWTCTQDTATNASTISWTLKGAGSASGYYKSAPFTVTIAGEEVYYSDTRIELYNGTVVASGTKKITHNANGTKSFTASVKAAIWAYAENVSGSDTWELVDIPRAATITSAVDFNDEGTPSITYSNPAGSSATVKVGLYWDSSTALVSYVTATNGTTGTYNFTLSTTHKNAIYSKLKDKKSATIYYYVQTTIGSNTFTNKLAKTVSITNATPTFEAYINDTITAATNLTGKNTKIIKGYNSIGAAIEASAKKGASITSYSITNGGKTVSASSGVFTNTEDNKFICKVVDSRGNSAEKTITLEMVNYIKLTAAVDASIKMSSGTSSTYAEMTVTTSGNYFNGSFGSKSNALYLDITITQVETGAKYTKYITVPAANISGNTYTYTYIEENLPYSSTWRVDVKAYDKVTTLTPEGKALNAKPVFDFSGEDFNFNVAVKINNIAMADFVTEEGTSNGWYYRKWNSGKGECWKTLEHTTKCTNTWGGGYTSNTNIPRQSYPFQYASKPVEQVTLLAGNYAGILWALNGGNGLNGGYQSAQYAIWRPTAGNDDSKYYVQYYVYGVLA